MSKSIKILGYKNEFILEVFYHPTHRIVLTEGLKKGVKRYTQYEWNLGWLVKSSRLRKNNLFMVENLMRGIILRDSFAPVLNNADFSEILIQIEKRVVETTQEVLSEYDTENLDERNAYRQADEMIFRNSKARVTILNRVQLKPFNYRELNFRGRGFSVTCTWDRCEISLDKDYDEYMRVMESMGTFYVTKTSASARKMWKLVDALGESGLKAKFKSGEDFLDFLKKKRVSIAYVPTVLR